VREANLKRAMVSGLNGRGKISWQPIAVHVAEVCDDLLQLWLGPAAHEQELVAELKVCGRWRMSAPEKKRENAHR
jgi:hypothetical protein